MAREFDLVPPGTRVTANGEGAAVDISASASRTFLIKMHIDELLEQQSLDLAIWGSPDGENWGTMPILKLPQRFYRGETRLLLDLTVRPEAKFIRARWTLNRWGRVAPTPMFVFGVHAAEVAASKPLVPKAVASV
ncbi:MAG: hypothetical protein ACRD5F_00250 [Candidatus Acidiferrales bacterium]